MSHRTGRCRQTHRSVALISSGLATVDDGPARPVDCLTWVLESPSCAVRVSGREPQSESRLENRVSDRPGQDDEYRAVPTKPSVHQRLPLCRAKLLSKPRRVSWMPILPICTAAITNARAKRPIASRIPDVPGSEVLGSVRVGFGETGLKVANNRADLA